eukprot:1767759-Amphidinium_carterae.1
MKISEPVHQDVKAKTTQSRCRSNSERARCLQLLEGGATVSRRRIFGEVGQSCTTYEGKEKSVVGLRGRTHNTSRCRYCLVLLGADSWDEYESHQEPMTDQERSGDKWWSTSSAYECIHSQEKNTTSNNSFSPAPAPTAPRKCTTNIQLSKSKS